MSVDTLLRHPWSYARSPFGARVRGSSGGAAGDGSSIIISAGPIVQNDPPGAFEFGFGNPYSVPSPQLHCSGLGMAGIFGKDAGNCFFGYGCPTWQDQDNSPIPSGDYFQRPAFNQGDITTYAGHYQISNWGIHPRFQDSMLWDFDLAIDPGPGPIDIASIVLGGEWPKATVSNVAWTADHANWGSFWDGVAYAPYFHADVTPATVFAVLDYIAAAIEGIILQTPHAGYTGGIFQLGPRTPPVIGSGRAGQYTCAVSEDPGSGPDPGPFDRYLPPRIPLSDRHLNLDPGFRILFGTWFPP